MSKPDSWMPFYVADYLADTMHFKTAQHGAYVLLLFAGWIAGGALPDDDEQLAAIAKLGTAEFRKMRPILAAKFEIADGVWRQKRLGKELAKAGAMYTASVENGKRGGRPKKPRNNPDHNPERTRSEPGANPEAKLELTREKHNHNHSRTPKAQIPPSENHGFASQTVGLMPNDPPPTDLAGPKVNGHDKGSETRRLRADAVQILEFLNEKTGRNYQPVQANVDPIVSLFKQGFDPTQCRQVIARKAREWTGDPKMETYIRPKTLFNRTNFANYAGELVVTPEAQNAAA